MDELHFQSGYRHSDSYSKEEFFSNALKYLRDEYLCPPYFFDEAVFSNVNKIDIPIIKAIGINKNILALRIISFIPLIAEIIIVIILNKKIRKVVLEYGDQMNKLYEEREKLIKEERIEAYERCVNKNIDYKQKRSNRAFF